jgi:hypothetical protein
MIPVEKESHIKKYLVTIHAYLGIQLTYLKSI